MLPNSANQCQSPDPPKGAKAQLALAVARGLPVSAWARKNKVPRRTAFRWAQQPAVRVAIDSYRRRAIEQDVGRTASRPSWARDGITELAKSARSESVRLAALRFVLSDMIDITKLSVLEERVTKLEEKARLEDQRFRQPATPYGSATPRS
jgi:hypothetical protein